MKLLILLVVFTYCESCKVPFIVDLSSLLDYSLSNKISKLDTIKKVDQALRECGYFIAHSANMSHLVNESIHSAKTLFSASDEIKSKYSIATQQSIGRGYLPFGSESGVSSFYEVKEGFSYGHPYNTDDHNNDDNATFDCEDILTEINCNSTTVQGQKTSLEQENIWPPHMNVSDKSSLEQLFTMKSHLAYTIMINLASYLAHDIYNSDPNKYHLYANYDEFIQKEIQYGEKISLMRLFHYFSTYQSSSDMNDTSTSNNNNNNKSVDDNNYDYNSNTNDTQINIAEYNDKNHSLSRTSNSSNKKQNKRVLIGSSPHTDWGLLTLITYNGISGLQFFHETSNTWYDLILPLGYAYEDIVIVNGGDYLKLLSYQRYHSPIHRVVHHIDTITTSGNTNDPPQLNDDDDKRVNDDSCLNLNNLNNDIATCNNNSHELPKQENILTDGNRNRNRNRNKNRLSFVYFYYPNYDSIIPTYQTKHDNNMVIETVIDSNSILTVEEEDHRDEDVNKRKDEEHPPLHVESHFKDFEYNTLSQIDTTHQDTSSSSGKSGSSDSGIDMDNAESKERQGIKFGEYITMKWKGVYRS